MTTFKYYYRDLVPPADETALLDSCGQTGGELVAAKVLENGNTRFYFKVTFPEHPADRYLPAPEISSGIGSAQSTEGNEG